MLSTALFAVLSAAVAAAHEHAGDPSIYLAAQGPHKQSFWYRTLPGDGNPPSLSLSLPPEINNLLTNGKQEAHK